MIQDVMQLSKLLLTGYQFSSVRIPIEYGGCVTGCGLDAGLVALVKQKVMH